AGRPVLPPVSPAAGSRSSAYTRWSRRIRWRWRSASPSASASSSASIPQTEQPRSDRSRRFGTSNRPLEEHMTSPETPFDPNLAAGPMDDADWVHDWDDAPIVPRARMPRPTKLLFVVVIAAAAFAGGVFAQRHWGKSTGSSGNAAAAAARLG